ncbi:hypothetical protein H2200_010331 [Cladophialophora chaetospira]|uniref:Short chain dehydrogenase n=1 Tax=Cladophialophora chaetospira TaxID=386627 RepID=A0AA39CE78_9EURO|nr:hypothetical protein H2200_010331 [Cladophialophora chaetospira]
MAAAAIVVLITGANSGVGYAAAEVIAEASESYHVVLSSRNLENAHRALIEISSNANVKGSLSTLQLDVTDRVSVEAAAREVLRDFGKVDVLINNAGNANQDPDFQIRLKETLAVNVIGPALVVEVFKPLLLKSSQPRSIHITSGLGSLHKASDLDDPSSNRPGTAFYRISKAALNMLVVEEAKELGPQGIKTFAICPGLVRSNIRGRSEEAVSAGGKAGDPRISGQTILRVIEGQRDQETGKVLHKDGVYPW